MTETSERSLEATFGFVDVSGFTALTEAHGDRAAADLIQRFEDMVRSSLRPPGSIIDFIGDAVLVTYPDPTDALRFATELFARAVDEPNFPDLRAGLHHGPAIVRNGKYFGATINLASRVAAHARGGQVLATAAVALAAPDVATSPIGTVSFRNVLDPVALYSVDLGRPNGAVHIDPVCRMRIEPDHAVGRLSHGQTDHWFCSLECAAQFARSPEAYATAAGAGRKTGQD